MFVTKTGLFCSYGHGNIVLLLWICAHLFWMFVTTTVLVYFALRDKLIVFFLTEMCPPLLNFVFPIFGFFVFRDSVNGSVFVT